MSNKINEEYKEAVQEYKESIRELLETVLRKSRESEMELSLDDIVIIVKRVFDKAEIKYIKEKLND